MAQALSLLRRLRQLAADAKTEKWKIFDQLPGGSIRVTTGDANGTGCAIQISGDVIPAPGEIWGGDDFIFAHHCNSDDNAQHEFVKIAVSAADLIPIDRLRALGLNEKHVDFAPWFAFLCRAKGFAANIAEDRGVLILTDPIGASIAAISSLRSAEAGKSTNEPVSLTATDRSQTPVDIPAEPPQEGGQSPYISASLGLDRLANCLSVAFPRAWSRRDHSLGREREIEEGTGREREEAFGKTVEISIANDFEEHERGYLELLRFICISPRLKNLTVFSDDSRINFLAKMPEIAETILSLVAARRLTDEIPEPEARGCVSAVLQEAGEFSWAASAGATAELEAGTIMSGLLLVTLRSIDQSVLARLKNVSEALRSMSGGALAASREQNRISSIAFSRPPESAPIATDRFFSAGEAIDRLATCLCEVFPVAKLSSQKRRKIDEENESTRQLAIEHEDPSVLDYAHDPDVYGRQLLISLPSVMTDEQFAHAENDFRSLIGMSPLRELLRSHNASRILKALRISQFDVLNVVAISATEMASAMPDSSLRSTALSALDDVNDFRWLIKHGLRQKSDGDGKVYDGEFTIRLRRIDPNLIDRLKAVATSLKLAASKVDNSAPSQSIVSVPPVLLHGWDEIFSALARQNSSDSRKHLSAANKRFDGPIITRRGSAPFVDKAKLIQWYCTLESLVEDAARKSLDSAASVASTHNFGARGIAVPDIGGSIKSRRIG